MKARILLVGENPRSTTGNGHMMAELLDQIDYERFEVAVFAVNESDPIFYDALAPLPYQLIPARHGGDEWGKPHLIRLLATQKVDIMLMVGIDCWRYADLHDQLIQLRNKRGFRWVAIFPYDNPYFRDEWHEWISAYDFPCVYSKFGYDILDGKIFNLRYFRPPMANAKIYTQVSPAERLKIRSKIFQVRDDKTKIFGFIGPNQARKEPHKFIKAFLQAKRRSKVPLLLYLHTEMVDTFNLYQMAADWGAEDGDIMAKPTNRIFSDEEMVRVYNGLDCLVNPSSGEGLSWVVLNAMACGTPVIATDTTAHKELLDGIGSLIPCVEDTYIPVWTKTGQSHIQSVGCSVEHLRDAITMIAEDADLRRDIAEKGTARVEEWLDGVDDINELLTEAAEAKKPTSVMTATPKIQAVLFVQHSAAGDVLMTTRCFKGLKERHPDLPLHYMTSPQYINIIEGNPYVDKVIPWNADLLKGLYQFTYNPHGDRILPGQWGRNSNALLSDFYWKILMVEPDDFFIRKKPIEDFFMPQKPICIVHTTGGDPQFRTYKYMADVCKGLQDRYCTVQVGGGQDYPAGADIDLRGKLTFQETAWVVEKADMAVTVDSFISHLCGALGVSQVCLFGSGNYHVVRPNQLRGNLICRSIDYITYCKGLGPCSAAVRDCPAKCTGLHNPEDILADIELLESKSDLPPVIVKTSPGRD